MLVLAGAVTTAGAGIALGLLAGGHTLPGWAGATLVGLALPAVAAAVVIRFVFWHRIANSVEVTHHQLPELHRMHVDLVARMGLNHTPRLFVANGQGALGAYAAKCQVRRGYVVLFSDLLDIAYLHGDTATIRFVLAHELGHIKCGHVALWRTAIRTLPRLLLLDRSVTRAQEYTADRCAAHFAPDGAQGLLALYAGKRMYRHVDPAARLATIRPHRDAFWLRVVNVLSTHPVGHRRLEALAGAPDGVWDVHGRMC